MFQEFVRFQENQIDLLQYLEVDIDEAFLASFTFQERDQIASRDLVNDELEDLTDVGGISVHSLRVGHLKAVRVVQRGLVGLETLASLDDRLFVRSGAWALNIVLD